MKRAPSASLLILAVLLLQLQAARATDIEVAVAPKDEAPPSLVIPGLVCGAPLLVLAALLYRRTRSRRDRRTAVNLAAADRQGLGQQHKEAGS